MKRTRFYICAYDSGCDHDAFAVDDILNIHKHLMKNDDIKLCFKKVYCGNWISWIKRSKFNQMCFNE